MRSIISWVTIYQFFYPIIVFSLGDDMVSYHPILVIIDNSLSLVVLVFHIVICHKTKLWEVGRVKNPNLKLVINPIYLMVLGICFKNEKLGFGCNFDL